MYNIEFSKGFLEQLRKIDSANRRIISEWINRNLLEQENPRLQGKPLKGPLEGFWRYRIGQYRIIAEIVDDRLALILLDVGHRRDIYK